MTPLDYPRFCERCEQRLDLCHCSAQQHDNEFEAMLEEPDEGTLERLRRAPLRSTMVARHTPRRLRRQSRCWDC